MKDYCIKNGLSLFWGGPYSQWDITPFTYKDKTFNCCEQFMMYCKALVHDDFTTADRIMANDNPSEQKMLGRLVKGFSEEKWSKAVSTAVVYIGNYCKFTQNEKYKEYLENDPGNIIVEASPCDKIWGIGLSSDKPQAWHVNSWRGENRLGYCITDVKEHLFQPDTETILNHLWCEKEVEKIFAKVV